MPVMAVVGACWGDEGKGKIADFFAERADYVVRWQGGANAGHTLVNRWGKTVLHLLPSGVFHEHTVNVLGPATALDPWQLLSELDTLKRRGVRPRVALSDRAQIVLPVHRLLDELEEERLGQAAFGSTRRGIAPFYADRALKINIRLADLFDGPRLPERIARNLTAKNVLLEHLYRHPPVDAEALAAQLAPLLPRLRPLVTDVAAMLRSACAQGKTILLEGQLGALRDPDHGIYPYVTSSSPLAGGSMAALGLPHRSLGDVIAVVKAYATCVGAGPFVSQIAGDEADALRRAGGSDGEYGATTGRPRRVGWFDAVAARYGCALQGATAVALTNLDVLSGRESNPVCEAYEIDGVKTYDFPASALDRARPVLTALPGWRGTIRGCTHWDRLPPEARAYVGYVEDALHVPVRYVSTGPERESLIVR